MAYLTEEKNILYISVVLNVFLGYKRLRIEYMAQNNVDIAENAQGYLGVP